MSRNVASAPIDEEPEHRHAEAAEQRPGHDVLNSGGTVTVIGKPPVSAIRTPRQISIVPSVTTKEWMRNLTTSAPLMAPRSAPAATAAGAATIGGMPKSRISTTAT